MAKKENTLKLSKEQYDDLYDLTARELLQSRLDHSLTYRKALAELNSPNLALAEAEKKSPIKVSYQYNILNSDNKSVELRVDDDKEFAKLKQLFNIKDAEQASKQETKQTQEVK